MRWRMNCARRRDLLVGPDNDRRACVVRVAQRSGATGSEDLSMTRRFLRAARVRATSSPDQPGVTSRHVRPRLRVRF